MLAASIMSPGMKLLSWLTHPYAYGCNSQVLSKPASHLQTCSTLDCSVT